MFRFHLYFIMVVVWFSIEIEGACSRGRPQSLTTVDNEGKNATRSVCLYQNKTHEVNTNWSYSYPDCLDCRCTASGWSCCGYGINAGVFQFPEDCQLTPGTCEVILVKKSDPSKPCIDTESSTTTTTTTDTTTRRKKCIKKKKLNDENLKG